MVDERGWGLEVTLGEWSMVELSGLKNPSGIGEVQFWTCVMAPGVDFKNTRPSL